MLISCSYYFSLIWFSPNRQPSKMQIVWQYLFMKSFPIASNVLYGLFLLSKWILTCISASTAETEYFVHSSLTNMAPPFSTRTSSFLSALRLSLYGPVWILPILVTITISIDRTHWIISGKRLCNLAGVAQCYKEFYSTPWKLPFMISKALNMSLVKETLVQNTELYRGIATLCQ